MASTPQQSGRKTGTGSAARPKRRRILIVSPDRDDRRRLFDALDRRGFRNALTAQDTDQARQFLETDPDVGLVFLDLGPDTGDVAVFCGHLAEHAAGRIPIIGILGAEPGRGRWNWEQLPPGIREIIRSPVDAGEVLHRMKQALRRRDRDKAAGDGLSTPGISLFDQVPDGLLLVDPNTLKIIECNAAIQHLAGLSREELCRRTLLSLDDAHDAEQKVQLEAALKRDGRLKFDTHFQGDHPQARKAEVTVQLGVFEGHTQYLAVVRDLWHQQQVEQAFRVVGETFDANLDDEHIARLVEHTANWLGLDFLMVGARVERHHQIELKALYSRRQADPDLAPAICDGVARSVLVGDSVLLQSRAWQEVATTDQFIQDNNIESYIGLPIVESTKEVIGLLVGAAKRRLGAWSMARQALQIVADRLALEFEMRRFQSDTRSQGLSDTLTRLPNRLLFDDRLALALKEAQRTGELFAVMFVDMDRFKTINDSLGHNTGDLLLKGVGRRLSGAVRASDTVARYAADQFTVVLRHVIQKEDVLRIARKLNESIAQPLALGNGREIQTTASIGISFYPDDGTTTEELIKHAEQAMYQAKGLGRNTCQSYVGMPEESHQQKLLLESKLRHAERNNEFRVYYQPQVSAQTEDIVGMEALIRWEHPELGLISPGFFIPLAEETGLIVPIGEWLMRTACAQVREWRDRFRLPLRLGVNLSALQLKQPDIVKTVGRVLAETGFDPGSLDLEVTESISLKDVRDLLEVLQGFRDLGCGISIDDFGTGQSSLDYIKRFPADRIKIDQTFVRNIGVDPDDAAIVEATISMAHNLKRAVVAEGVEEEGQLEFLHRHGCEELQGYLFCRPLPAQAFERLLADRERLRRRVAEQEA